MKIRYSAVAGVLFLLLPSVVCGQTSEEEKQKLDQDPTKVITRVGVAYNDLFSISGSVAIDPVRKINVILKEHLDEWRVGGSWLFSFGIVNVNFGRREFDSGVSQTNYSIGTFVPLSTFGISPLGIQLFPMAGYTYNDGEIPCDTATDAACLDLDPQMDDRFVTVSSESHSGYLGMFGLKPLTDKWSVMAVLNGSVGTNDYSGWFAGGGLAYQLTKRQSLRMMFGYIDNSYGSEGKASVGYSYQFN